MKNRHKVFVEEKKKQVKTHVCNNDECKREFKSLHPTKKYCCKECQVEKEQLIFREELRLAQLAEEWRTQKQT